MFSPWLASTIGIRPLERQKYCGGRDIWERKAGHFMKAREERQEEKEGEKKRQEYMCVDSS